MGNKKFRRLPITKLGKIKGILTVTDILRAISKVGLPNAFDELISDWMTHEPKTSNDNMLILDAVKMMSDGNFGSLLIINEETMTLKGIMTERDVLMRYKDKTMDKKLCDIDPSHLAKGMVKVELSKTLEEVINVMTKNKVHRVLTEENGQINGILTANDITQLCSREREELIHNPNFLKSVTAQFISTSNLTTIDINNSIADCVELMAKYNIGSLPVTSDGEVVGIFTERDYLHIIAGK